MVISLEKHVTRQIQILYPNLKAAMSGLTNDATYIPSTLCHRSLLESPQQWHWIELAPKKEESLLRTVKGTQFYASCRY